MVSIVTIIFKETYNSLVFLACYMYIMLVCYKVTYTIYFSSQLSVLIIHNKYLGSGDHFSVKCFDHT